MCGLAGIFSYHYAANPVDLVGPDTYGGSRWRNPGGRVALRGPIPVVNGGQVLVLEGGVPPEAVFESYRRFGAAGLRDLGGDFSAALWDADQETLVLARGDSRSPSLRYADDGWAFGFASTEQAARELIPGTELCEVPARTFVLVRNTGAEKPSDSNWPQTLPSRRPVRILGLVTDAYGGYGGIARYNRDFLGALAAQAHATEIVVLPRLPEVTSELPPPHVLQLKAERSRVRYVFKALQTAILGGPFDVVFCGHLHLAPVAAAAAKLLRIPMWATIHGFEVWEEPGAAIRWGMESADLLTAVSRHTRSRVSSWLRGPRERVRVLPNTFNEVFTPGPAREDFVRRFRQPGGKVLLTVSRLGRTDRYKGLTRVIDAFPDLLARHPSLTWIVAGEGDDRANLERLCEDRGIARHVHFTGRVPDGELADYYRLADLFVLPSTKEGFGIVFVEAAAAGAAVIGGNVDGSVDALAGGAIGTPVTPGNNAELVQAIERALAAPRPDPGRVRRFNRDNFQRHVRALMDTLLAQRARP